MEKSTNNKGPSSLESTLIAAKSFVVNNPKTVHFDNNIILKIKNIITDFPEQELSSTKILNAIALKWLEEHRDELLENHYLIASKRY